MALILTRSPFHISRGALDANAGLSVEISRYVNGAFNVSSTYNLTFRNKTFIDISNLINSEFVDSFVYNPSTSSYEGTRSEVLLVRTTLSGTIDNVAQSDVTNNYYATDGYLYSSDSMNEDLSSTLKSNGYYAGSTDIMYKLESSSLNVPLLNTSQASLMANKTTNPNFDTDSDWAKDTADWTISNGAAFVSSSDLAVDRLYQLVALNGLDLLVQFEVTDFSGTGTASMRYPFNITITGNGTYRATGTGELDRVQFQAQADDLSTPLQFRIDNVFVGETTSATYEEVTVDAKFNGSTVGTQTIEFDSSTDNAYQEVSFNIDDIDEVLITTDHGTKTVEVKPIKECKFSPYILTFKNRYGVDEDLWFFKKSTKRINVSSEDFMANQFEQRSAGLLTRSNQEYNKNGKESIELNSGFVPEAFNESFKQLLLSEEVKLYDYDNNEEYAVKVTESSLTYKTSVNDKLINYTIGVEFSNNVIDNIV